MTYHNVLGELCLAYTPESPLTAHEQLFASLLAEPVSGYALDKADRYARQLSGEAEGWLGLARERSRMSGDTLVSKALSSLAFSLQHRARSLAVPSKLVGTSRHQRVLWDAVRAKTPFGTELSTAEAEGRLLVALDGQPLGAVQNKHLPWLRPLVPFGARVFLVRVMGHEHEGYRLGVNVAFGRVGAAVTALRHALGQGTGGDGYGGDGAAVEPVPPADTAAHPTPSESMGVEVSGDDPADVILWRDERGAARIRRRQGELAHVVRHSPTGPEWGYGGSGPADLALSVLSAFTDKATALRLYQRFKAEVVALVPKEGGVIHARAVCDWLAHRAGA